MKTLRTIIAFLVLAIACVSCDIDKKQIDKYNDADLIVGKWRHKSGDEIFVFNANGTFENRFHLDDGELIIVHGPYTYEPPFLTIGDDEDEGDYEIWYVTISEDKMTIEGEVYYRI